jgi:3-hydroxymyristoyl/3-hydroxydecanoyl-(acyl carrier protein) dehydratase
VTGNEIQFLGHFPEHAVMPGTLNRPIGFHSVLQDNRNRNATGRVPGAGLHQ